MYLAPFSKANSSGLDAK